MPLGSESFVPVCTTIIFVCTSKGSKIQRFSVLTYPSLRKLSHFTRYRKTANSTRKNIVCTSTVFVYISICISIRDTAFFCYSVLLLGTQPFYKSLSLSLSVCVCVCVCLRVTLKKQILLFFFTYP